MTPPRITRSSSRRGRMPRLTRLALKLSGIDKDFKVADGGPGYAEKDAKSGEPTGILRSCTRYVKSQPSGRRPTELDRTERLLRLFKDYNAVGLTTIGDRDASRSDIDRYRKLREQDKLSVRIAASHHIDTIGAIEKIQENIRRVAENPLVKGDARLRIVGIKTYLDGGMLTGSAYMRQPWGVSKIYSIKDPKYRGVLFISKERSAADRADDDGVRLAVHGAFRRRRRGSYAARRV